MTTHSELYRFPSTFSQRQLWYVQATAPENSAYNIPFAFHLRGRLDVPALQRALALLVARHDALRTHFEVHDEAVLQVVDTGLLVALEQFDLSAMPPEQGQAELARQRDRIARHVFDLGRPPLLVLRLLKLGDTEHVLLSCIHHIVMDHISVLQFGRELQELYAGFRAGRTPSAIDDGLQYPDYAVWQAEALDAAAIENKLPHWVESLHEFPHQLDLPTDHPRPSRQALVGEELRLGFSTETSRALRAFANREQQTLFTVMLSGLGLLLRGYCGSDRVIVGCPFANRGAEELEQVMGLFMNLLPVGIAIDPQAGFTELVRGCRRQMMKAQAVQDTPFEKIVHALHVHRDPARNPLVQAWFTFQDAPMALQLDGLEVDSQPLPNGGAKLDLSFWFWDDGERIQGLIEFDSALFEASSIARMGQRLEALLARAVAAPELPVSGLSLIAEQERAALEEASQAPAPAINWSSPHQAFFERASATPRAVALRAVDGDVSAGELAARADAIAEALQQAGIGASAIVGLCLARRAHLPAALLGVLRAGAAYLPLDPDLPAERIAYMLEDSGASALLVDAESAACLPERSPPRIDLDTLPKAPSPGFAPAPVDARALAYLIYTSGSTGRPKGVRIGCAAAGNFLASMAQAPGLQASDRLLALTTCAFDIAVLELLLPLATGATLVLGERRLLDDPAALIRCLEEQRISALQATPSTWRLLRAAGWAGSPGLKAMVGGEALTPELAAWLQPRVAELWNLYGPTETTVWSSLHLIEAGDVEHCPIGLPIAATGLHVVDAALQRLPIGIPGELLITGAGLAEGYHQRAELDAERFVRLPETGERAYRSGDVVIRGGDGRLRHLGRRDHQVKLRGFRIELGEIEARLSACEGVSGAAAGVWRIAADDHRLVAWVSLRPGRTLEASALRAQLGLSLPSYMLPQHFVELSALPLLPNGKLDRARLPWPVLQIEPGAVAGEAAPLSPMQSLVLGKARDLLGSELVELDDNFFDAGGHSLLALSLGARLEQATGVKLALLLIAQSSLRGLAAQIEQAGQDRTIDEASADASTSSGENAQKPAAGIGAKVAKLFGFAS